MFFQEALESRGRTALFQGASSVLVRENHGLGRIQDLCRFCHEVNATEGNHVSIGFLRVIGETQRVSNKISDVLDHADLVVVGKDHRISLRLETKNLLPEVERWRSSGHPKRIAHTSPQGKEEIEPRFKRHRAPSVSCRQSSGLFERFSGSTFLRKRYQLGNECSGTEDPLLFSSSVGHVVY